MILRHRNSNARCCSSHFHPSHFLLSLFHPSSPILRNQRGIALITVVIMMISLALIGATLIEFAASVNLSSQTVMDEVKALYLAEAGISYGIHSLRNRAGSDKLKDEKLGPVPLGEGSFTVEFSFSESLMIATGTVHGVSKRLELQYNVF